MSKPREVSVGIFDEGKGEIDVWCVKFRIKGALKRVDGKVDETDRLRKEKQIQKVIEQLTFED